MPSFDPTAVLGRAPVYRFFMWVTGNMRARGVFVREIVCARAGDRVLDIGCGTGEMLAYLPAVTYDGFDLNPHYVSWAQRHYGSRGRFHQARVSSASLGAGEGTYDIVLASGLLHHLDDDEALALFRLAHRALKPGGRFFTLDGCYVEQQSAVERLLLRRDRGRYVRTEASYLELARGAFTDIAAHRRRGLLYVPYTLIALECRRSAGQG